MKSLIGLFFFSLLTCVSCSSNKKLTQVNKVGPETCKTKMQSLNGTYTGECKNGLAQGNGKAVGKNKTYTGEFDAGYPDGKGTLVTRFNGKQQTKTGYWDQGSYVGEKRITPYKITDKQFTRHVIIRRVGNSTNTANNQVKIRVMTSPTNVKKTSISNIALYGDSGDKSNSKTFRGFENVSYPFKGRVDFYVKTAGDYKQSKSGHVEFVINAPGSWLVIIKAV